MELELNDGHDNIAEFLEAMHPIAKTYFEEIMVKSEEGFEYSELKEFQERVKKYGLSFDYGLDAEPMEFKTINFNLK